MKTRRPRVAPGWISTPVTVRATLASSFAASRCPLRCRADATRWIHSAGSAGWRSASHGVATEGSRSTVTRRSSAAVSSNTPTVGTSVSLLRALQHGGEAESAELAVEVEEGVAVRGADPLDLADQDRVVAAGMGRVHRAGQHAQRVRQVRCPRITVKPDPREPVDAGGGEPLGQILV